MSSIFDRSLKLEPWQRAGSGNEYNPDLASLRALELSERATLEVYEEVATREDPESRFVLIGMDGMLRAEGHLFKEWKNAVEVAIAENMAVYSATTARAVRPVWYERQLLLRSRHNVTFEPVILHPAITALDKMPLTRRVRRIFKTGE